MTSGYVVYVLARTWTDYAPETVQGHGGSLGCFPHHQDFLKDDDTTLRRFTDRNDAVAAMRECVARFPGATAIVLPAEWNDEKATERREWLIYNATNGRFWGPQNVGYFDLAGAGLYVESEARLIASNKSRMDQAHHITEYRDQIATLRGPFERLNQALLSAELR